MKTLNLIFCLLLSLAHPSAYAQVPDPFYGKEKPSALAQEFYVGQTMGKPLITVHVIHGVKNPGVYHIPIDTDILELVAYAGGGTPGADMDKINVRSQTKAEVKHKRLDVDDLLREGSIPRLADQDTVYIPEDVAMSRALQWTALTASVVGIISAVVVLSEK